MPIINLKKLSQLGFDIEISKEGKDFPDKITLSPPRDTGGPPIISMAPGAQQLYISIGINPDRILEAAETAAWTEVAREAAFTTN